MLMAGIRGLITVTMHVRQNNTDYFEVHTCTYVSNAYRLF